MFLAGKGDTRILPYELNFSTGEPKAVLCDSFHNVGTPLCGIAMLPKRCCNVREIEVAKFLCLSQTSVQPVSFYLPRSEALKAYFQDDIYGPAPTGDTNLNAAAWFGNENQDPVLQSLQPDGR